MHRVAYVAFAALIASTAGFLASGDWSGVQHRASAPAGVYADGSVLGVGDLAFISHGTLDVLNAATGSVRPLIRHGWTPSGPVYSADGRWLAYTLTSTTGYTAGGNPPATQLWMANSNGSDAHEVPGLVDPGFVGWSPTADLLAVITGTQVGFTQTSSVLVVSPNGSSRMLANESSTFGLAAKPYGPDWISSAGWSPNGSELAVAIVSPQGDGSIIRAYPVEGGQPTTWFSISGRQVLPGLCTGCGGGQTIAQLAGWWSRFGIGFWVFSSGMTHNNDQTPIELLPSPGATPHIVGETLSDGTTDAVASSASGKLAIVDDLYNGGREFTTGKAVETCDATTGTCAAVPDAAIWPKPYSQGCGYGCPVPAPGRPGSGESIDPSWSPDGQTLAFVRAPSLLTSVAPVVPWDAAHQLSEFSPATGKTTAVVGGTGASLPEWSRDGKELLYVAHDELWLISANGGKPAEVAGPLLQVEGGYYSQVPWAAQFAWSYAS